MLAASRYINDLYDNGRAQILVIEAPPGYGKSAYGVNIVAEVHSRDGVHGNWDINIFKRYMGFHPQKVLEKWDRAHREKVFLFDDAGAWLNTMDFSSPLVKRIGKQLQTIRTKYSCVIFTCLNADDLARKVRMFSGAITVRISLMGSEPKSKYISEKYRRTAVAKHWDSDWYGKSYRSDDWTESFNCYMPRHFYEWYTPIREHYSDMLTKLALKEAKKTAECRETLRFAEI